MVGTDGLYDLHIMSDEKKKEKEKKGKKMITYGKPCRSGLNRLA